MTTGTLRTAVTSEMIDKWATDPKGPVALHMKQKLTSVEGDGGVIFPPTYAGAGQGNDSGYNIDELNGKKVATIDSVGSQANRMEPIFNEEPFRALIPQIKIHAGSEPAISILDVGHRLGDALVRSTELAPEVNGAFTAFLKGDGMPIAKLAPTSMVFGVWDSRGTSAKIPRILQSVIRAWDVDVLTRSAQYEPPLDVSKLEVFSEADKSKAEGNKKSPLAQAGFVHVPSTDVLGGVVARGPIVRDVTINLIALRRLSAASVAEADKLRRYVLGLALVAATQPLDGFLRQGCLLTPDPDVEAAWVAVARDGTRTALDLREEHALDHAKAAADAFGVGLSRDVKFDKALAKGVVEDAKKGSGKGGEKKLAEGSASTAG